MAIFNKGPGGRIPPDGRPAQAPGVGRGAKRHDLERPATPGLGDPSMQYGDVKKYEAGQRIAPITNQAPAVGGRPPSGGQPPQQSGGMVVPDPMQFLLSRGKGTKQGPATELATADKSYIPLLRAFANAPRGGGALRHAYVTRLGETLQQSAFPSAQVIDLDSLDAALEEFASGIRNY